MKHLIIGASLALASLTASAAIVTMEANITLYDSAGTTSVAPLSLTYTSVTGGWAPADITPIAFSLDAGGNHYGLADIYPLAPVPLSANINGSPAYWWPMLGSSGADTIQLTIAYGAGIYPIGMDPGTGVALGSLNVSGSQNLSNRTSIAFTTLSRDGEAYTGDVAPVPVPGSLALLGVGAVGLIATRRKQSA